MENSRELMLLVDAVATEKSLPTGEILSFLAEGIEVALRKKFPEGSLIQVEIDEKTGEIKAWRLFELVDQIENVEAQMLHNEIEDEEVADGYVWERFEPKLSRQQFNITKQVALQKIKSQSIQQSIQQMLERPIQLYNGILKVIKKDFFIVDCQGLNITIYRKNLIPREMFKIGDKIKFTLYEENGHYTGTRTSEKFLTELFKDEINAIQDGDIEIVACARNPGMHSKIIVKSNNNKFEAVRMCIGAKGIHIKNVQQDVFGEFIDIIAFDSDPAQMLIKSIAPVNVTRIVMDEDEKTMDIAVANDDIAQAIGRGGKNIEMISNLIGWNIKVKSDEQWEETQQNKDSGTIQYFIFALSCDEELASYLNKSGIDSIEEIAYVSRDELELDELDEDTISSLKENAMETLSDPLKLKQANGIKILASLGFDENEVSILINNSIFTNEDVADLSTYDLQDFITDIDMDKAKDIIMKSRNNKED